MDRYTQIRCFILIAEKGSFAAAAAAESVTPAIMGRRLTALEDRLGVKLMHRSTRRLKLTELGAQFLDRCRTLLRAFDETESSISHTRRAVTGDLTVSAPAGFGRKHVACHAPGFLAKYPTLRLSFSLTDNMLDLVRDKIDVAVRIGGVDDPGHVAIRLHSNRRVVCGTPGYFKRHGLPRSPEDLLNHNCLTLKSTAQGRGWIFRDGDRVSALKVQGNLDCDDGESLFEWVRKGLGVGWRSAWEIQPALARGELLTVLDEFAVNDYDVKAVYPQQRFLPAKVPAFIKHLKAIYKSPGYWQRD